MELAPDYTDHTICFRCGTIDCPGCVETRLDLLDDDPPPGAGEPMMVVSWSPDGAIRVAFAY